MAGQGKTDRFGCKLYTACPRFRAGSPHQHRDTELPEATQQQIKALQEGYRRYKEIGALLRKHKTPDGLDLTPEERADIRWVGKRPSVASAASDKLGEIVELRQDALREATGLRPRRRTPPIPEGKAKELGSSHEPGSFVGSPKVVVVQKEQVVRPGQRVDEPVAPHSPPRPRVMVKGDDHGPVQTWAASAPETPPAESETTPIQGRFFTKGASPPQTSVRRRTMHPYLSKKENRRRRKRH